MGTDHVRRLAGYYGDLLKQIRSSTTRYAFNFRDRGAVHEWVDLSLLQVEERLASGDGAVRFPEPKPAAVQAPEGGVAVEVESPPEAQAYLKLLRMVQALGANPYERELIYGLGLVTGSDGRAGDICAPLLMVPARLEFDPEGPAVRIALAAEEFHVNAALCAEFCEEPRFLEEKVFSALPSLPLAEAEMVRFVNALKAGVPALRTERDWTRALEPVRLARSAGRELRLAPGAVLLLVTRSHHYLLKDLADLAATPRDGESILGSFWTDPPEPPGEAPPESLMLENFVFPFESNAAQRLTAESLRNGRVVVVQGPPGTGKSQTICNLVSHLVSTGKSVLVTSQKNKALEVVAEKLGALGSRYLSLTLLKDDTESKRQLAESIDGLDDHLQGFSGEKLARAGERLEKQLEETKALARATRVEFARVQAVERAMAEAAREYHELRDRDVIPATDAIPEGAEAALRSYAAALEKGRPHLDELEAWASADSRTGEAVAALARQALELRKREEELLADPAVRDRHGWIARDSHLTPARVDSLLAQWKALEEAVERAYAAHARLEVHPDPVRWVGVARDIGARSATDIDRLLAELAESDTRARAAFANRAQRDLLSAERRDERREIAGDLSEFRARRRKLFRIFDGRYRRARSRLGALLDVTSEPALANLEAWTHHWEARIGLSTHLGALPAELQLAELFEAVDGGRADAWETAQAHRRLVLEVAAAERSAGRALAQLPRPVVTAQHLLACPDWPAARALLNSVRRSLEAIQASIVRQGLGTLPAAEAVIVRLPAMDELRKLRAGGLKSMPGMCRWLREHPDGACWIGPAVQAARRRLALERSLQECPARTGELADAMRDRRERLTKLSRDLLQVLINRRLHERARTKKVANDIQFFRKSIRRGKKSYRKFEELKSEFDFGTLLQIFPCWIMGLEDVARVFPLEPGLFDVVIVDEASQCHLMGALPVLYRARKALVVGDEKQLPNADVMFLQDAVADELFRRHGVGAVPRAEVFDGKRSSLLDMATVFCDGRPFLNEHFRSWPEIIRFCNERFYQGRLRIATDSSSNTLGPVLNLVPVAGASDDPERRVNEVEARRIVDDVIAKLDDKRYRSCSFGVLSLFRDQTLFIERLLQERLLHRPEVWEKHRLIVDTVDGFQGDERDVIFYSFRYGPGSSPGMFTVERDERRINVAFTRARRQVFCYVSRPVAEFPAGFVREFLAYVSGGEQQTRIRAAEEGNDPLAVDLVRRLRSRGLTVAARYPACGFRVDVVAGSGERRLALEVDGDKPHQDDLGQVEMDDLERQEILERAGWRVVRVPARIYWADPERQAARIAEIVQADGPVSPRP